MQKEGTPQSLSEVMRETSQKIVQRIRQLANLIPDVPNLDGSQSSTPSEVAALLHMLAELSKAESSIVKESASIVLSKPATNTLKVEKQISIAPEKITTSPKTFQELLELKIEKDVLPPDKTTFTKNELFELTGRLHGKKTAFEDLNLPTRDINRQNAFMFIEKALLEPIFPDSPQSTSAVDRLYLRMHYGLNAKDQLSRWAKEIGYDWNVHPTVGWEEAKALRGLKRLEDILKTKEAKKSKSLQNPQV